MSSVLSISEHTACKGRTALALAQGHDELPSVVELGPEVPLHDRDDDMPTAI
jgi:hypothetical protein